MAGSLSENGNLTGYSAGDELSFEDALYVIEPIVEQDNGAHIDPDGAPIVHQGVIGGLNPDGSGVGYITPTDTDLSLADQPGLVDGSRKPLNIVRSAQSDRAVAHQNMDSVLFVCIWTSAGDMTARFMT